jgi:hypothetical protein
MGRFSSARNRESQFQRFYKCGSIKTQRELVTVFRKLLNRNICVIMHLHACMDFYKLLRQDKICAIAFLGLNLT